ncbi:hypothetical protein TYRP_008916 [Tyrophagus putrescentiae]|nr:hypothetical protein TYRP_008916 [Tyrophagus putrescentiae]
MATTTANRQEVFRQLRHLPRLRTLSTTLLLASRLADCPIFLPVLRRLEELNVRVKLRRSPSPPAMERAGLNRALQLLVWRRATAAAAVVEEEEEARMLLRFDLLLPDRNRGSETMTDGDVDHLVQRILEAEREGGGDEGGDDGDGQQRIGRGAGRLCRLGRQRLGLRRAPAPITLEALAWTTATFKALTYLDFAVEQWYSDAKEAKAAAKRDDSVSPFSFTFSSLISRLRELPLLRELKFSLLQPAGVCSLADDDADFASFKLDYHHLHLLKRVFPAAERITFVLPVAALLSPEWKKVMCRFDQSCSVCDRVEALVEAALKEKAATTVIIPVHPDPWAQEGVLTAKDDGDDEDDDNYEEIGHLGFYKGEPEFLL